MQEIEKLRAEIDSIHIQLAALFKQRLIVARRIWEIKKNNQMSFIDSNREDLIVHQFDTTTESLEEQKALQNFFKCTILETKKYLEAKLK